MTETGPATLRFMPDGEDAPWILPDWAVYREGAPTTCRSCRAVVLWVESRSTGKRAPINPDGISHFATCPDAAKWRKPK